MDKIAIRDFPEAGTVETYLLLKNADEKESRNGSLYLTLTLFDGKQEIKANMWNTMKATFGFEEFNVLVACKIEISVYNGAPSYTVRSIRAIDADDDVNIGDFVATSPVPPEELYEKCIEIAYTITDPELMQVVSTIYEDNKEKLLTWGAAKSMHHNIRGGLLWHQYRMAEATNALCQVYSAVNRDMAVAGALLHDIGKLVELETDDFGASDYTLDGQLFGHLMIGANLVTEKCKELCVEDVKAKQLAHIIVSHHGELEWGAIAIPRTPEAMLIHFVDNTDAKLYAFESALDGLQQGECSEYNAMLKSKVYKF